QTNPDSVMVGNTDVAGGSDTSRAFSLFMEAMQDVMLEKNDAAFEKFSTVVALQPQNAAAYFQLSKLWVKKHNLPKALETAKKAYEIDSTNKWMIKRYADLLMLDSDFTEAAT